MSEMIDRVSAAILAKRHEQQGGRFATHPEEDAELARVAIEAMREPTEAMLGAGPGDPYLDAAVWSKVIDEALLGA